MHIGSIGLTGHPIPPPPAPHDVDTRDPIADLLSQLSNIRRTTSNTNNAQGHGHMHQIQVQLQLERHHMINRQLELVPRTPQRTLREFTFPSNVETYRGSKTIHAPPPTKLHIPTKWTKTASEHNFLLKDIKLERNESIEREQHKEYAEEIFFSTMKRRDES